MGAVPVLVRVRVRGDEEPTVTVPKLRLAGLIWRCDWAPLPVSGTVVGEFGSVLVTVKTPVRVPAAVGVKAMVTGQLVPGARVAKAQGRVMA